MTTKEYLMRARELNAAIDRKLERIMRLRAQAERRTATYGELIKGARRDQSDIVVRIVDGERELDRDIDKLLLLQVEIDGAIKHVQDDTQRMILELRYLNYYSWEQISKQLNYERTWLAYMLKGGIIVPSVEEDWEANPELKSHQSDKDRIDVLEWRAPDPKVEEVCASAAWIGVRRTGDGATDYEVFDDSASLPEYEDPDGEAAQILNLLEGRV